MNDALLFVLMGLAAFRLYRLLGIDAFPLFSGPRSRLEDFIAERWGDEWADGLSCPWCLGSWCSIAVVAITAQYVDVLLPVLQAAAVAAVVGLLGGIDG